MSNKIKRLISTNPGKNYEVLGSVPTSSRGEIRKKVQAANQARKEWKSAGIPSRATCLRNVVTEFRKRKQEFALLITKEIGMPITQSRADVDDACRYLSWYLDHAQEYISPRVIYKSDDVVHTVFFEPLGTAVVISPWNYPLSNFVWGVGQNLLVGNTIVFKHSEECPLFGKVLEEIVEKHVPKGVFSEVYGDGAVGDYLIHQNIQIISFTGSSAVGKHIYRVAGEKFIKVVLEMGGSAVGIVFDDANVDEILESIYFSRFSNCGQMCDALKRLFVHKQRFGEVVEKMKDLLLSKRVGDPQEEQADIGPLVAKRQLELLELQVTDALLKGAKVVTGGEKPKGLSGAYYKPTLLVNVSKEMRVWKEEVFGPVLPIMPFATEREVTALANDTAFGLGGYIFTRDHKKAQRVAAALETGMVSINGANYVQPWCPFGGYKTSGLGREHGEFGFQELTQIKIVAENR